MHLKACVSTKGDGFPGVFLDTVAQQPVDIVNREQWIVDRTGCCGGGAQVQKPAAAHQVACHRIAQQKALVQWMFIAVQNSR